jgi:hypothetical protein
MHTLASKALTNASASLLNLLPESIVAEVAPNS